MASECGCSPLAMLDELGANDVGVHHLLQVVGPHECICKRRPSVQDEEGWDGAGRGRMGQSVAWL